jgi:hypothetical protein
MGVARPGGEASVGTLGGGNGNGELPGLPPEWGAIVVPDDPSELAEESAAVRAELRRGRGWRRLLPGRPVTGRRRGRSVRLPALLLTVALFAAFAGLFTLGYGVRRPVPGTGAGTPAVPSPPGAPTATAPRTVPALDLIDSAGRAVALRSLLPAVILLTEGCTCDELVVAADQAAPPGAYVVVVARRVPAVPAAARARVRPLADPAGELRSVAGLPASSQRAGALLATRSFTVIRAVPSMASIEEIRADLPGLLAS